MTSVYFDLLQILQMHSEKFMEYSNFVLIISKQKLIIHSLSIHFQVVVMAGILA